MGTRQINNLSTSDAENVIAGATGWAPHIINNTVLRQAQADGEWSYRGIKVIADDDAQCYHVELTEEED